MFRKLLSLLMVTVLALAVCACSSSSKDTDSTGDETELSQIANPYADASDSDIYSTLNIPMASSAISDVKDEFIVGGEFAQIDFAAANTEWTLRAQRDVEDAVSLAGLYYTDFTEPVICTDIVPGLEVSYTTCDEGAWNIYTWSNDGITYALFYAGTVSDDDFDAVMQEVMTAVGLIK